MDGFTGWLAFRFAPGTLIGNVSAVAGMSPNGHRTDALTLDGHQMHVWSEPIKSGEARTWTPPTPVAATSLKIMTTRDISWVSWHSVTVSAC